jgi:hypothetical protein
VSIRAAAVASLLLSNGCLFAPEEDAAIGPSERVEVVAEEDEPFDPSKAVEDDSSGVVEESQGAGDGPQGEEVATEAEAEAREESAQQTAERINETSAEDDEAKAAAAANPIQEDPGSGEPWTRAAIDWALELVFLALLAAVLSVPCLLVLRWLDAARLSRRTRHPARPHALPARRSMRPRRPDRVS